MFLTIVVCKFVVAPENMIFIANFAPVKHLEIF